MALKARFNEADADGVMEIMLDEAGRGCFAGPIMAGAVILPPESEWTETQRAVFLQLRDSKRVAPKKRERLADELRACLPTCGVGSVSAAEINERGIQWANREAFRRAIQAVLGVQKEERETDKKKEEKEEEKEKEKTIRLVIDGTLAVDDWKEEQELVVEGDGKYIGIAGASILAKVTHDRWIRDMAVEHPEWEERYHLIGSKGYGTARHREGIRLYGGCEQHRELFIQRWLPNAGSTVKHVTRIKREHGGSGKEPMTTCLIRF